jgi:hypothetical protein
MSRTAKKAQRSASFQYLPLPDQIQAARPIAEALISQGIDPSTHTNASLLDHIVSLVPTLDALFEGMEEADRLTLTDAIEAARATGIALGLLLRPEAFLKGGAQ